ncbi:Uncharacterised protein [Clostridium perfringens]|nr:Uncharacterised protein [Clostridium perfringens]
MAERKIRIHLNLSLCKAVFSCNELPRNYVDRTEGF